MRVGNLGCYACRVDGGRPLLCATPSAAVPATSAAVTMSPASFVMPLRCGLDGAGFGEHAAIEPQRLADRPRLERTAARRVRPVAVGDLGEMTEARVVEMREQRFEEAGPGIALRVRRAAAHAHPRLDER